MTSRAGAYALGSTRECVRAPMTRPHPAAYRGPVIPDRDADPDAPARAGRPVGSAAGSDGDRRGSEITTGPGAGPDAHGPGHQDREPSAGPVNESGSIAGDPGGERRDRGPSTEPVRPTARGLRGRRPDPGAPAEPGVPDGRPRRRRRAPIVGIALVAGLVQIVGCTFAGQWQPLARPLDVWGYLLLLAGPVALLAVRRYPLPVLLVAAAASFGYFAAGYPGGPAIVAAIIALVATVLSGQRLAAWVVAVVAVGGSLLLQALTGGVPGPGIGAAVGWTLVILVGSEGARFRRERMAEQRRRAEEYGLRCASEERLRIARELHDVLGHHISLINVQAGVALHLMENGGDPEQARGALAAIKVSSKEVLREMRSTLGVMRDADEGAPRGPVPGLAAVPELVGRIAEAGLPVRLDAADDLGDVGEHAGLAAYRIVQEALTNVRRHAPGAAAVVTLRRDGDDLLVTIVDDGPGRAPSDGSGRGIAGMTERAAALGGTLVAGPGENGGFRVHAVLPVVAS